MWLLVGFLFRCSLLVVNSCVRTALDLRCDALGLTLFPRACVQYVSASCAGNQVAAPWQACLTQDVESGGGPEYRHQKRLTTLDSLCSAGSHVCLSAFFKMKKKEIFFDSILLRFDCSTVLDFMFF